MASSSGYSLSFSSPFPLHLRLNQNPSKPLITAAFPSRPQRNRPSFPPPPSKSRTRTLTRRKPPPLRPSRPAPPPPPPSSFEKKKKKHWKDGEFPAVSDASFSYNSRPPLKNLKKKLDDRAEAKAWAPTVTETLSDKILHKQWQDALEVPISPPISI